MSNRPEHDNLEEYRSPGDYDREYGGYEPSAPFHERPATGGRRAGRGGSRHHGGVRMVTRVPAPLIFAQAVANAVIAIGALVFAGWLFDLEPLKRVLPGLVAMKVNAALCFVLAGISLRLLAREPAGDRAQETSGRRTQQARKAAWGTAIAVAGAVVVALVGLLTLGEYLFNRDLGLDQLVLREEEGAIGTAAPGRMAPATALNFLLLGGALLLALPTRAPRSVGSIHGQKDDG